MVRARLRSNSESKKDIALSGFLQNVRLVKVTLLSQEAEENLGLPIDSELNQKV